MPNYTSRAEDAAEKIKQAEIAVEQAQMAYRKNGNVDAVNKANRALADAHDDLYTVKGGRVPDTR